MAADMTDMPGEVFGFARLHIPTGTLTYGREKFLNTLHLLTALDGWNRIGQGVWQYWRHDGAGDGK